VVLTERMLSDHAGADVGELVDHRISARIVGVVVKILIPSEGIDVRRNILCTCAEAAKFGDMLICDLRSRQ
jgi:hypothetical protein